MNNNLVDEINTLLETFDEAVKVKWIDLHDLGYDQGNTALVVSAVPKNNASPQRIEYRLHQIQREKTEKEAQFSYLCKHKAAEGIVIPKPFSYFERLA